MRTLIMASPKGGVGKTTLAGHLAVEAESRGAGPVALVDFDAQGSLASWWNVREAQTPVFAAVNASDLTRHLAALERSGIALVVIDTPPGDMRAIQAAAAVADFVVIPVRPSPHDLRAITPMMELVEQARLPFCFVVNAATPRSTIAADAVRALAAHGKVAPTTVHARVDFATSMIDGRTAGELNPNSRSAQEVSDFWIYVNTQIRKAGRT